MEADGLKILFMANAPWAPTGYGVQGKHLVPRLKAAGYDVTYFAFYGLAGGTLTLGGTKILPMGHRPWGEDILSAHMKAEKADVLVTLMDVWVTDFFGKKAQEGGWAWLPWTPIDQEPVPDLVLERLEGSKFVLPYSRFGERMLREGGVENIRYVPHGYDPAVFHPGNKASAREIMKLPEDRFIIGMVAANKGYPARKCFPEQMLAFAKFHKKHPDAFLYLHTLKSKATGGLDLGALAEKIGLKEGEDFRFVNQYLYVLGLPEKAMALTYQAIDVLSATSMAEGFGLPILEAQACGTPVVTTDFSSMPELLWSGYLVEKTYPFWTPLNSWVAVPDVNDIERGYEEVYEALHDPERAERMKALAVKGAKPYEWDHVVGDYWLPLLDELGKEIGGHRGD